MTDDYELIKLLQIVQSNKNLNPDSMFTTIYPYQIKLPYNLVTKFQIPAIEKFYVYNELIDKLNIPQDIPDKIFKDSQNIFNIESLNSLGYYNPGYGLWYKTSTDYFNTNLFTSVNFFFNSNFDNSIPGWVLASEKPLNIQKVDSTSLGTARNVSEGYESINYHKFDHEVYVYAKLKMPHHYPIPDLKVKKDGTFKVVQLADLHLSTGFGKCQDIYPSIEYPIKNCLADELTLQFVISVLDIEKPDLVVLTGDQIYGPNCFDSETALLKILTILINKKIPYAFLPGNHDDDNGTLSRLEIMKLVSKLPYSVTSLGPDGIKGVGNYQIVIQTAKGDKPAIELFMLDSHSHFPQISKQVGYDYFSEDQKEFVQIIDKTLIRQNPSLDPQKLIKMAFFHIPLFEYKEISKLEPNQYSGKFKEKVMSPNINTGMFQTLKNLNVKLVSVGHDHCNDFCFQNNGVTLCYGGAAGFGGYGGHGGYIRRIRVFEIHTETNQITTWKRLYNDLTQIVDPNIYV